jgi:hypothetical protein
VVKHKGQKNKPVSGKTQRTEEQTIKWLNAKDRRTNHLVVKHKGQKNKPLSG